MCVCVCVCVCVCLCLLPLTLNFSYLSSFEDELNKELLAIVIVPTYEGGLPNLPTKDFYEFLLDAANDFRVGPAYLARLNFAVFSLGDSVYGDNFGAVGRRVDECLRKLGATRMLARGVGDAQYSEKQFEAWLQRLWPSVRSHSFVAVVVVIVVVVVVVVVVCLFCRFTNLTVCVCVCVCFCVQLLATAGLKAKLAAYRKSIRRAPTSAAYVSDDEANDDKEPLADLEDLGRNVKSGKPCLCCPFFSLCVFMFVVFCLSVD